MKLKLFVYLFKSNYHTKKMENTTKKKNLLQIDGEKLMEAKIQRHLP